MQSYNFATFWVEQWVKFLSAAGEWPAVDRDSLDAQLAELRAGADKVESELKSVADERVSLRRELATAEQTAKSAADGLAEANAELARVRELAVEERRRFAAEIGRLQRKASDAATSAGTAIAERNALENERNSLATERTALTAELHRLRSMAANERQALEAQIVELRRVTQPGNTMPSPAAHLGDGEAIENAEVGLEVHFKKPAHWADSLFIHYWDDGRRTAWPGEPMTAESGGWFVHSLSRVRSATIVFNDNTGHQTSDLARDRDGWYDGKWHDRKPGRAADRKPGKGGTE